MWHYRIAVKRVALAGLAALVLVLGVAPARAGFEFNSVKASVVRVITVVERDGKFLAAGHGTGFVINDRGHVVTNHHVINPSKLPKDVTLKGFFVPDGSFENMRTATVVWSSEAMDLAVLEVAELDRAPVTLAEGEPESGAEVWPVGFPGVAENFASETQELLVPAVSNGVVAKVLNGGDPKKPDTIRRLVQHGAALNPGNSGGPLFNACNQVVGINTFGAATVLPVKKVEGGKFIASGAPPSGVFFSTHVSVLIRELKANNFPFTAVGGACVVGLASDTPFDIYIYIALAAVLAAAAIVLALRKPRERVVRVVESYSQMLRRKGSDSSYSHSFDSPQPHRPPPRAAAPPAPASPTATQIQGSAAGAVWSLSGVDGADNPVRFDLREGDAGKSGKGVTIGRNQELCDLTLDDPSVSRRHARFLMTESELTVEDLSSSNGTCVDGGEIEPYTPTALRDGTEVMIGGVKLTLTKS